jgi:hypothetical protein
MSIGFWRLPHIFKVIKEAINGPDETSSEPTRLQRSSDDSDDDNEDNGYEHPTIEKPGILGTIRKDLESINSTLTRRRRALGEEEQRLLNITLQSVENIDKLFTQLHEVRRPAKSKVSLILQESLRLWSQSKLNSLVIEALKEADSYKADIPGDNTTSRDDTRILRSIDNDSTDKTGDNEMW